ncbi:PKD domain-containing protein [Tistlia consotensis]|uniref:PKD domain-containing protein n=1 Tax=Tistlia consotensis USBA 355 TaxID=560819 RepID=A0A1Y6CC87_9PROT|nr:PKD domain-containing protein [Tistlia consotensis]SMF56569.1 PKD domain-containing protein [Tistlia consotensis USBA 355]SNR44748.1 PKD domain-containing protein [Tistlia consotensis]
MPTTVVFRPGSGRARGPAIRHPRRRLAAGGLAALLLLPTLQGAARAAPPVEWFVKGTVETQFLLPGSPSEKRQQSVALPHVSVFLYRARDPRKPIASTLSDLSGRFLLKTGEKGPFTLCVEAEGFRRDCPGKPFEAGGPVVDLGRVPIQPATDPKSEFLAYGKVTLQDGGLPRAFEPAVDVNSYATVRVASKARTKSLAYVNDFGEYVVPRIPVKADFRLAVQVDKATTLRDIKAITGFAPGRAYELDVVLPNRAPQLRLLSVLAGGKPVQVAQPGGKVDLLAVTRDRDGDKLSYRWLLPDGSVVGPTTDSKLTWQIPAKAGNYPVTVVVSDQRGGYAKTSVVIKASTGGATFSGTVLDGFGLPVNGAQVEVNGRLVNTNVQGWFSFAVPVKDRYVMNIRSLGLQSPNQRGFGTASFVYKAPIAGGRWTLRRAQVTTVDPTQPIVLQQKRDRRDCVGPRAAQIDWSPYLGPGIFQWQDGHGDVRALVDLGEKEAEALQNVMALVGRLDPALASALGKATGAKVRPRQEEMPCGDGIRVAIPANALIDRSTNQPPTGPVQLSLSTVSLTAADQMPGDYSALDSGGKATAMESFGAGSIDIGAGNARYNLKPGATATVTIPVDVTQLAGGALLPPKIPFLYYDEQKGTWRQEDEAALTMSGGSPAYEMKVKHFSTLNADILKTGQSCLAVELDPAAGFTLPLTVEVVMQPSKPNPSVIQVRQFTLDSTQSNVIYNLPNNSDIVLTPIVSGVKPDGSSGDVPAGVFVVNTGGPQTSAVTPPAPNPDGTYYAEDGGGNPTGPCASRVTLTNLGPVTIAAGFEFLQGLSLQATNIDEFGAAVAAAIDAGSADYYLQADARGGRASLNLFKQKNHFGDPTGVGEIEVEAQFANSGDLGFGRDMHCRRNAASDGAFDYACYVTNFGQPPANNPDQQDANDTVDPAAHPDATVAMEFSRVENPPGDPAEFPDNDRAVKFFVYNTNDPDGPLLRKADLDGNGARPVPQLCMICHGGTSASVAADPLNPTGPKAGAFENRADILSMRANFLPFDLHFYNFPASKSKASQQDDFKDLNIEIVQQVSSHTGTGDAIVELVDLLYNHGASASQLEQEVVANWDPGNVNSNRHRFYRDVFARACRTCHVAQPFGAPTFTDAVDFEAAITNVQTRVCVQKVMPHAKRTSEIFWTSLGPSMPAFLDLYGQTLPGWSPVAGSQCGGFYQSGGIAPSVWAGQIFPILTNNCSGCHSAPGLANFSVGGGVNATYNGANGVTTVIAKDGSAHYVVPNDLGNSLLYQRITTGGAGVRMPQGGANLAVDDTDVPPDGIADATEISAWINAGATGP